MDNSPYFLVSATYKETRNGVRVVLISRDVYGNRVIHLIPFEPYFYIRERDYQLFERYVLSDPSLSDLVKRVEPVPVLSDDGERVLKVVVYKPRHVKRIRDRLSRIRLNHYDSPYRTGLETYEADILFPLRFLIDSGVRSGYRLEGDRVVPVEVEQKPRLLFLDIEVYSVRAPFGNYEYPVLVIGCYDSYTRTLYQLHSGGNYYPLDTESLLCSKGYIQIPCQGERELLLRFRELVQRLQPDAVVSFTTFDLDYIVHRMQRLGLDYYALSPVRRVRVEQRNSAVEGLEVIDIAELYKKVFREPAFNTLGYISQKELGVGKIELPGQVWETWNSDPALVLAYNARDVELTVLLEEKLGLVCNFADKIRRVVGCNYSDIYYPSRLGDILYLRLNKGKTVLRSRPLWNPLKEKLRPLGALVKEPKPGLYRNVLVLDFKEMYPSIIETFHISWDTFAPYTGDIQIVEGVAFRSDRPGWTAEILRELRQIRSRYKQLRKSTSDPELKRMYQMYCDAYKTIINAAYGAYAYAGTDKRSNRVGRPSRLYSPPIAASITFIGRQLVEEAMRYLEETGYEVVYLDTDGLFIQLHSDNYEEEATQLRDRLLEHLQQYVSTRWRLREFKLDLDIDKIYTELLLLTRKRYMGWTTEGEEVIKGLEAVRGDSAELTAEAEIQLGRMIREGASEKQVSEYIYGLYRAVCKGEIPLEKYAVRGRCAKQSYKTLTRNLKALIAAKELLGLEFREGERFLWVYLYPTQTLQWEGKRFKVDVIAFRKPEDLEDKGLLIDRRRMAEYTVLSPLKRYLSVFQYTVTNNKQYLLADFL